MEDEYPPHGTAGTALGFENPFTHPEGLLTARNLVRLLLAHKVDDRQSRGLQRSQQTPTNSCHASRPIPDFSAIMPDTLKQYLTFNNQKVKPRKRKGEVECKPSKQPRLDQSSKAKRLPKPKVQKKEPAKYKLDHAVWMRILEFTPPQFLGKARLICKDFQSMVDQFTSIYVNCRMENYGHNMPPPPLGLTERQYSNLLGSKGCLEPGCPDKGASRTHWSWAKRWCVKCWRSKIEREDRLIKNRADRMGNRTTFMKLLECIPVGMHDSFMKPHDYVDVDDNRPRGAPRLYKYYLKEEVEKIIERYESLTPDTYRQDPNKSPEENAAALALYQEEMSKLDEKRTNFLTAEKAKVDAHMALVQRIEAGVRERRESLRTPYDKNRAARKELFTRRAKEDLPHIDEDFVKNSTAFKAATRVFRDGGTERGWQTLKPKIENEWRTMQGNTSNINSPQVDSVADDCLSPNSDSMDDDEMDMDIDGLESMKPRINITSFERMESGPYMGLYDTAPTRRRMPALPPPSSLQLHGDAGGDGFGDTDFDEVVGAVDNSQVRHPQNNITGLGRLQREVPIHRCTAMQWSFPLRALPPPSYMASNATSMSYTAHMPVSSIMRTAPIFPGVIPTTATPSSTATRTSHISISSLVHKFDE